MGFCQQLCLLLWKNFTLRKHQPVRVVVEIVWPLVLFVILVSVRFRPDVRKNIPECHYEARAMPSSGTLPFLRSFLCFNRNDCKQNISGTDIPRAFNSSGNSPMLQIFDDLGSVLSNSLERNEIMKMIDDISLLNQFLQEVTADSTDVGPINLRLADVLVSRQRLTEDLTNRSIPLTSRAVDTLFNSFLDVQKVLETVNSPNITQQDQLVTFLQIISSNMSTTNASNNVSSLQIMNLVCEDKILLKYFDFGSNADANDLNEQLCNLTSVNMTQLWRVLYRNIDQTKLLFEAAKIVSNVTERNPHFDWKPVFAIPQIIQDLNGLSNLNFLAQDFSAVYAASSPPNASRNNLISMLSVVCNGSRTFFDEVNANLPKDLKDDKDTLTYDEYSEEVLEYQALGISRVCANLFATMSRERASRILWRQLKPVVLGFINYAPDTPASRAIIKEANRTFESIASTFALAEGLYNYIPQLQNFMENNISAIRNFVESPACKLSITILKRMQGLPQQLRNLNESVCNVLSEFLSANASNGSFTWREALTNTYNILDSVRPYFQCVNLNKFVGYRNTSSLVEASLRNIGDNTFWSAIFFDSFDEDEDSLPPLIKYTIRMDSDKVDGTKYIMNKYWRPGNRDRPIDLKYWLFGFIYLQDMIDHAIIRLQTNHIQEPGVYTQQFPYGCYVNDRFTFTISRTLPLFMVISWIYTVAMIIKGIVYEKEQRLKEVMKIMGLGNGVHWLAWFINSFVMMMITVIIFLIIVKAGKILEYSDPSVILLFMIAFTTSTISQCFLISVFFSRANLAAVCGGFIYFILFLPYSQLVQFENFVSTTHKILASLLSNVAMGYGMSYFSLFEEQTVGAQWHNLGESPLVDDTYNLRTCIGMMFLDSVIYFILTWYIEAVIPGQYGMPRKWYFLVQKSYWFGNAKSMKYNRNDSEMPAENTRDHNENFEEDPKGLQVGVAVRNLRKIYNKGDRVAVDGLTINFYEGQITSFLGHNGAGKTTTLSILTGLFPPTSGTAYIYGRNILSEMDEIRSGLGLCPQHNVLFDLLTVEEHLWFYARLKGRSEADVKAEIEQMIKDVGLPHKRKEKSKNLSGGMKRKLSVAIAFMGRSRTVILDEPTAGVDPYARRAIWKLLLKFRKGRTVILSTHHMNEADVLGDRIAIISQGKLRTVGTSLFLKNRFGSGYYLTLVREDVNEDTTAASVSPTRKQSTTLPDTVQNYVQTSPLEVTTDTSDYSPKLNRQLPGFNRSRLTAIMEKHLPGAKLVEDNNIEVCYRLPENDGHTEKFENLFVTLEKNYRDLGISSYGISDTSLEEVFLKVADDNAANEMGNEESRIGPMEISENGQYPKSRLRRASRVSSTFFKLSSQSRANSSERLTEDVDDTDSVTSEALDVQQEIGFAGAGQAYVKGSKLVIQQLLAMFLKRFHHVRRSKKGFISEIILPAAFVSLAMIFSLIRPPFSEEPPLELQPWMYEPIKGDPSLYVFYSNNNQSNPTANALENNLLQVPYYGTRCMNSSLYHINGKPCKDASFSSVTRSYHEGNLIDISPECSCESGFQKCPASAGGPEPSKWRIRTNDNLYNVTGRNISQWLVKTEPNYQKRRFGGFVFGQSTRQIQLNATELSSAMDFFINAANVNQSFFTGSEQIWKNLDSVLQLAFAQDNVKVWFNNKGWASSVSYMNALNNLILRTLLPPEKDASNYGIVTINHPMNLTKEQLTEEIIITNTVDVLVAICVIFAMSFVPASFVLFLIEERVSSSKHLQFVSGIRPIVYWLGNLAWDILNYSIPALLCILLFLAFGKAAFVSSKSLPSLFALLFLYGWAIIPMMYPFSRLFDVPSSAFVTLSCVNVFLGTVTTLATFILETLSAEDQELKDINTILKQVFLLLPQYCLGRGLIEMASMHTMADLNARLGEEFDYSLFEWSVIGRNLFSMIMMGIFFNIFNLLIEYNFFLSCNCWNKVPELNIKDEDLDVVREKQRVLSGDASSDVMRLQGLTKVYRTLDRRGRFTAVNHLYIGVPKGQCFGLLGVNGAGKTTTFKMLTGDESITEGDAFINQYSIRKKLDQARQCMGYCPQFDALDPLLTAREHLEFYARVRGISYKHVKTVADWAINRLDLVQYGDKISSSYSGGNKRKLSTAIALIGNPPIIFLDEPTTGMDPGARRFLWNCINSIVKSGRSVILTSHSMEECEALCNRLAIMVNGSFMCLGSIQHLKNKFGGGYTIILRVSGQNPDMSQIMQFISSSFPSAKLREKHHNMLQYQLGTESMSLSKIFHAMELSKKQYNVEDYSVSQTTLDQVFINFAKKQMNKDEEADESENHADDDTDDEEMLRIEGNAGISALEPPHFDERSLAGSTVELMFSEGDDYIGLDQTTTVNGVSDVSII